MGVIGEAWRNWISGATRAARVTLLIAALAAALAYAEWSTVTAVIESANKFRASGASITVISALGAIDGAACDNLSRADGSDHSGALRRHESGEAPLALPKGPVGAYTVTEGLVPLLVPDSATGAGALISQDVADVLGLAAGDELALAAGTTPVRGIYQWPDDGRRTGYGYAMMLPAVSDTLLDECWVEGWPVPTNTDVLLRSVVNADPADPNIRVELSQVNTSLGRSFDGYERFAGRVTRYAPLAALGAGLLLGFFAVTARRLEFASAQHVGVSRTGQLGQVLLEYSFCLGQSAVIGWAALAAVTRPTFDEIGRLVGTGGLVWAAAAFGVLAGASGALCLITESRLFRYFKTR
jgi:hypothetical protein